MVIKSFRKSALKKLFIVIIYVFVAFKCFKIMSFIFKFFMRLKIVNNYNIPIANIQML